MQPVSYARHQFPPEIIRHAIWLYLRFTLSYRDLLIGMFRFAVLEAAILGAITATSFARAVEGPANFQRSHSVGAWLGLTTRRYQSGEVDYDGHISRRGDRQVRGLLFEAATVILTRSSAESSLRRLGLKVRERVGFKRAAVAMARKLAVVMHAMLKTGTLFDRNVGAAA